MAIKLGLCCALLLLISFADAKPQVRHKVRCDPKQMTVDVALTEDVLDLYLDGFKELQNTGCQPVRSPDRAVFTLEFDHLFDCGLTKVVDKRNQRRVYYHRLIVEYTDNSPKDVLLVKCELAPRQLVHGIQKRNTLPEGFQEAEDYDLTTFEVVMGRAPVPILGIDVRQNGAIIGSELLVQPGTPLTMDVYLDKNSTSTYGLRMSYMDVTDEKTKEETIILNGCSVDPYLFENFNTVDGDTITARFRAFKFPETNFVLFRGNIDVCLDTCEGVECSNGQIGHGRRRRAVDNNRAAWKSNTVFQVTMTTVLKVDFDSNSLLNKGTLTSTNNGKSFQKVR